MRGTDSGESPPRREESKDLGKAIFPYVSSQDAEVREARTSSQDLSSGVKDRDDLLRWVRESFPGAYVQRAEEDEQEDSAKVAEGEGLEEQHARGEDAVEKEATPAQAEEAANKRSTDAPTSAEEEAAAILSEVMGNIHQNADVPIDTDNITAQVTTTPPTSESSHSSDEILLKDCVAQIAKGKKVASEKKAQSRKKIQKKEKTSKSKRKSFSDPEGEKSSASSKKEKKKKATQQAKDSDEDRFRDKASEKKFESVEGRGVVVERMIDEGAFEKFSEFKLEVKGNCEEGIELNEEVLKEITGGRTESWGVESRLPASTITAKYNILFRLGIQNWLLVPLNSSIVKELALLLFAIGTGKKFNLGRLIFQNIVKEADCTSSSTSLGYPALLLQYLLQHGVQLRKGEVVTAVKKLKISQKLFNPGKKIDLPVRRVSPPSMPEDKEEANLLVAEEYEKMLKEQLEDVESRQRALSAELFIIAKQKQKILSRLEILEKKKKREDDGHDSGGDEDQEA
ncbi:uncharacterized protein LOC120268634 [Dioscorea cayenensis subsp. rotundata]|uniref:Uncharacterized protein LOC120268634 n=1 Tax=Dioscorea cayennensis subsp. rotundata TaxID=55577 RepID=A0AB40C062_DIOCR|nr:uncharacterized protein LOC120268634 [Dioscorea cayenensis subsp. rotundata]